MRKIKLTILDKLHKIEDEKIIYNIHYCRAGVGFTFFEEHRIKNPIPDNWREGLVTYKYYTTFEEAVEAEYKKIKTNIS